MPGELRTFALQGTTGTSHVPGWVYWGDGSFMLPVVGESRRQRELWTIVGKHRRGEDNISVVVDALILPEPDNRFDRNAMRIFVSGQQVGYLSREDAAAMKEELAATRGEPVAVMCKAKICGGFTTRDGSVAHLGIMLDVDFPLAD